jgi:hypothetical protein
MKQRRIRTVEDLFAAPEGEWFYDPGPRKVEVLDETTEGLDTVRIPVPKATAARLQLRPGERFTAKYVRGAIVMERVRRRRSRGPA